MDYDYVNAAAKQETHDGNRDFWTITVLRATVSAYNEHTGEIREVHFGDTVGYPTISAALRAIGRTIDNDRS